MQKSTGCKSGPKGAVAGRSQTSACQGQQPQQAVASREMSVTPLRHYKVAVSFQMNSWTRWSGSQVLSREIETTRCAPSEEGKAPTSMRSSILSKFAWLDPVVPLSIYTEHNSTGECNVGCPSRGRSLYILFYFSMLDGAGTTHGIRTGETRRRKSSIQKSLLETISARIEGGLQGYDGDANERTTQSSSRANTKPVKIS